MRPPTKRVRIGEDEDGSLSEQGGDSLSQSQSQLAQRPANAPSTPFPPPMTFHDTVPKLPFELQALSLRQWIGPQRIQVDEHASPTYRLSFNTPLNPQSSTLVSQKSMFPKHLQDEYKLARTLSWIKDRKEFRDPYTFYMTHFLMSREMQGPGGDYEVPRELCWDALRGPNARITYATTWPVNQNPSRMYHYYPNLTHLHGLEKIKLDFDADQYFAFFDVALPPFDYHDDTGTGDNLYRDPRCHGAAIFLTHTQDLELHFGDAYKSANPWANVSEPDWCEENEEWAYREARLRPSVCESSIVIDWILEHAWHGAYLQQIPKITITGDDQEWVKEKWHGIFVRHAEYKKQQEESKETIDSFGVHRPNMDAMQMFGKVVKVGEEDADVEMVEDMDSNVGLEDEEQVQDDNENAPDGDESDEEEDDDDYRPQDHFPPACTCTIGCWRLRGGKVEEKLPSRSLWDQVSDQVRGSWMAGFVAGTGTQ
jgi:hypothetical protein